jgi:GNAT superfamily N-acetyltransferase
LDQDSKVLRFAYHVSDAAIDQLCDKWEQDHEHHILFCVENAALEFIGIGHIALQDGMELAFSVHKEHRGQSIGSKLMSRAIQYCRTHGILKGCMVCLSTNAVIKHLCVKHGIHMENDHGETLADIEFADPDFTTFVNEGIASNLGAMDYLSKRTPLSWNYMP